MWNRLISLRERKEDGTYRIVRTVFTRYHWHEEVVATYRTYDEAKEAYDRILKERARRKEQAQG